MFAGFLWGFPGRRKPTHTSTWNTRTAIGPSRCHDYQMSREFVWTPVVSAFIWLIAPWWRTRWGNSGGWGQDAWRPCSEQTAGVPHLFRFSFFLSPSDPDSTAAGCWRCQSCETTTFSAASGAVASAAAAAAGDETVAAVAVAAAAVAVVVVGVLPG